MKDLGCNIKLKTENKKKSILKMKTKTLRQVEVKKKKRSLLMKT